MRGQGNTTWLSDRSNIESDELDEINKYVCLCVCGMGQRDLSQLAMLESKKEDQKGWYV